MTDQEKVAMYEQQIPTLSNLKLKRIASSIYNSIMTVDFEDIREKKRGEAERIIEHTYETSARMFQKFSDQLNPTQKEDLSNILKDYAGECEIFRERYEGMEKYFKKAESVGSHEDFTIDLMGSIHYENTIAKADINARNVGTIQRDITDERLKIIGKNYAKLNKFGFDDGVLGPLCGVYTQHVNHLERFLPFYHEAKRNSGKEYEGTDSGLFNENCEYIGNEEGNQEDLKQRMAQTTGDSNIAALATGKDGQRTKDVIILPNNEVVENGNLSDLQDQGRL